jgi:hypothetical protein
MGQPIYEVGPSGSVHVPVPEQACGYVIGRRLASHQDFLKGSACLGAQGPKQVTEFGVLLVHRLVHQLVARLPSSSSRYPRP